jgi:hypothetical protein
MAEARLQSAAHLEIELPAAIHSGEMLEFAVVVRNVAAGHSLPTSLTELREMWVALEVPEEDGQLLFQSGPLEADAEIPDDAIRFGAVAGDAQGNATYKPWEVSQLPPLFRFCERGLRFVRCCGDRAAPSPLRIAGWRAQDGSHDSQMDRSRCAWRAGRIARDERG